MYKTNKKTFTALFPNLLFWVFILSFFVVSDFAEPQQIPPTGTTAAEEGADILKKKPFEEFKRKPAVEIEREGETKLPEPVAEEKKFFIKNINVIGNTAISSKKIDKLIKEYENKEVSLRELIGLADKITALYATEGYVTSQAYIPPQRIEGETVTIQVIEGLYGNFEIEGGLVTRKSILTRRFRKRPGEVFNYNNFRKDLVYLNGNPDRIVKAMMLRGELPKATDFRVVVRDSQPLHVGYEFSNTGNKYTGNWLNTYKASFTGLFCYDDDMNLRFIRSDNGRLVGGALGYNLPINEFGAKWGFFVSHFETWATHGLKEFDIKSWSTTYSGNFQHPAFDFGWITGTFDIGMDIKESVSETLSTPYSLVKLRILKTGLTIEESDKWGRSVIRNQLDVSHNNWLSARVLYPNDNQIQPKYPDASYVKYSFRASRINILPFQASLLLNAEGQMTDYSVYSSEQHRIGGAYSVRGHSEAAAVGDNGVTLTAEVRVPFYFIPEDFYVMNLSPRQIVQGVVFLDGGVVQNHQPFSDATKKITRLMGTGMGLRANLLNSISLRCDVGWAIGIRSTNRKPHIHLYVSYEDPTLQERENMFQSILQNKINAKLKAATRNVPADMIEAFEKARELEKEGKYEEAKELYESVVQMKNDVLVDSKSKIDVAISNEEEIKTLFDEAEKNYRKGDYGKAKNFYEQVVANTNKQEGDDGV